MSLLAVDLVLVRSLEVRVIRAGIYCEQDVSAFFHDIYLALHSASWIDTEIQLEPSRKGLVICPLLLWLHEGQAVPEWCEITILVVGMSRDGAHDCSDDAVFLPLEQRARRSEADSAVRVVVFRAPVAEVRIKDVPNLEVSKFNDRDREHLPLNQIVVG